jgi:hypothetical protein
VSEKRVRITAAKRRTQGLEEMMAPVIAPAAESDVGCGVRVLAAERAAAAVAPSSTVPPCTVSRAMDSMCVLRLCVGPAQFVSFSFYFCYRIMPPARCSRLLPVVEAAPPSHHLHRVSICFVIKKNKIYLIILYI